MEYTSPTVIYRGPDVGTHFLSSLFEEEERLKEILQDIKPLEMTEEDEVQFQNSLFCHICGFKFDLNSIKVRDHCHLSSKYQGASCKSCNLNFKYPSFIPVIFHGLKNFDSHIICTAIGKFKNKRINCIASSSEKYITFS